MLSQRITCPTETFVLTCLEFYCRDRNIIVLGKYQGLPKNVRFSSAVDREKYDNS